MWGAPPLNKFPKTYITPVNYVSSEREVIGESESFKILENIGFRDFMSNFREVVGIQAIFGSLKQFQTLRTQTEVGDLEMPNI